ncbi:MAG: GlsB/YeaQ/YmgE family stress response membrane protein [Candidatus Andeanibacterium colombiense]|uniref:GlsB/YeaQ/YmgE family stress response membrane protein n=1 Tax=Candidatus Andeanibacterium colombiense TaxID=3121345 RepID=A0AAJ5X489_9SPHN|nr:MAG: GlsB/YeaQ/YmgE family stress response membrane protein [Sphingomonadaceae bacterium]
MTGFIIALIVGGVAGWLASILMRRDGSMGVLMNIIVGCVGSVIGNALAGPLLGVQGTVQAFSVTGLLIAIAGAVVLLAIVNLVQRGRVR